MALLENLSTPNKFTRSAAVAGIGIAALTSCTGDRHVLPYDKTTYSDLNCTHSGPTYEHQPFDSYAELTKGVILPAEGYLTLAGITAHGKEANLNARTIWEKGKSTHILVDSIPDLSQWQVKKRANPSSFVFDQLQVKLDTTDSQDPEIRQQVAKDHMLRSATTTILLARCLNVQPSASRH